MEGAAPQHLQKCIGACESLASLIDQFRALIDLAHTMHPGDSLRYEAQVDGLARLIKALSEQVARWKVDLLRMTREGTLPPHLAPPQPDTDDTDNVPDAWDLNVNN